MRYLILIFFIPLTLFGQYKSDFEILNRMIDSSFSPVQDFLLKSSINDLSVQVFGNDEKASALIYSKILSKVKENQSSQINLEATVIKSEVRYPEIVSYPLFGEEKLKREIETEIVYIVRNDGRILFNSNFHQTYSDTVPISYLQLKSENSVDSNKIPSSPVWRNLVEPAVISSITGIIIYLFFVIRSK